MNDSELTKAITRESRKIRTELTLLRDYDQDKFQEVYQNSKGDLKSKGVNSFSGYVTYMLEEMMQKDKTFAKYAPKIEKTSIEDDRVILKDNIKNRIAEVVVEKGELVCKLCNEKDCVHVGFVLSLPDVCEVLNAREIKQPR